MTLNFNKHYNNNNQYFIYFILQNNTRKLYGIKKNYNEMKNKTNLIYEFDCIIIF